MMMEQDDFGLFDMIDMEIDEDQSLSNMLRDILRADQSDFFKIMKTCTSSPQQIRKFKAELHKIPSLIKLNYYANIYDKICDIFNDAAINDQTFKNMIGSNIFDFIFIIEKPRAAYSQKVFDATTTLVKSIKDLTHFKTALKFLIRLSMGLDKKDRREQLAYQLSTLVKNIKEKLDTAESKFKVYPQIIDSLEKQDKEEFIIHIRLMILDFLNGLHINAIKPSEEQFQQLFQIIHEKPYQSILEYALKNHKLHYICKQFKQQILSSTLALNEGKPELVFHNCKIHKDLLKVQGIFELALDTADESLFRGLRKDMLIIEGDQMYFKYNGSLVKKMRSIIRNDSFNPSQQSINNLIDLIKIVATNIEKKVRFPQLIKAKKDPKTQQEIEGQINPGKDLLNSLIYLFSRYFMSAERSIQFDMQIISQKLNVATLVQLLKLGSKWVQQNPSSEMSISYAINLIAFIAHLFIREQYNSVVNYKSDVSEQIKKILLDIKYFTHHWKLFKKIKLILERWGETAPQNCPEYAKIIRKFLDAYFDEKTNLKNLNRNLFNPLLVSRGYMLVAGIQAGKKILEILQNNIKPADTRDRSMQELQQINNYLHRFSYFYTARMKLPSTDRVADHLFKLYQRNAHNLSVLYNFRTWILYYSNVAKDNASTEALKELLREIPSQKVIQFKETVQKMSVEQLLDGRQPKEGVKNFLNSICIMVNNMELKSQYEKYGDFIYNQVVFIVKQLNDLTYYLSNKIKGYFLETQKPLKYLEECLFQNPMCIFQQIQRSNQNLTNVLRFYFCNLHKIVEPNDQVCLIQAVSRLFAILGEERQKIEFKDLVLINDILGLSTSKIETHLKKQQISRSLGGQQNGNQFLMNKEQFIPINIFSVLYQQIHSLYIPILKNLVNIVEEGDQRLKKTEKVSDVKDKSGKKKVNSLDHRPTEPYSLQTIISDLQDKNAKKNKEMEEQIPIGQESVNYKFVVKQARRIIHNLLFPSVNIYGPCYFNNTLEEKGKEDHAFGLFLDQFQMVYKELSSKELASLHSEFMMIFDACQLKEAIITNKQTSANAIRNRPGAIDNNRRVAEITRELSFMGINQEFVEIACQFVPNGDPDSVFEWIQNNADKIMMEKSKRDSEEEALRLIKNMEKSKKTLQPVTYNEFIKRIQNNTKEMIRKLFKQLYSEKGEQVKDIIFMCLDSFKEQKFRNTKYEQLTDKIFEELDLLNNQYNEHKLNIIVGSLQHIIFKRPTIIWKMHEKAVTLKLLTFIQKASQETGQKILQVINKTLPTPSEKSTDSLISYMSYIADILMNIQVKSDSVSQILFKITKAQNPQLNKKVLGVVCRGLGKGFIKTEIFSLLSIVLEADNEFAQANIQFDIKSFIRENVDFDKHKGNLLQVEAKRFSKSFMKFENNPNLENVCKKLFVKKKNRPNLFYDREKHDLYSSQILSSSFLSYELPETPRIIICSLVNLIITCENLPEQIKYIEELYKTLQYYKILIPYCLRLKVGEMNFFEWLLQKGFSLAKGNILCFLTFLFVRNGLFLEHDLTFSDYLIAMLFKKLIGSQSFRENKWVLLGLTYFLHIKNVNNKSLLQFSVEQSTSLKTMLQEQLSSDPQPIIRILLSECVYLISQNELIQSLLSKYKINEQNQFTLEKQFLNMDLFYSYTKPKNRNPENNDFDPIARRFGILRQDRNAILLGLGGEDDEELALDDDEIQGGIMRHILMRRISREQPPQISLSSVFVPRDDIAMEAQNNEIQMQMQMEEQIIGEVKEKEPQKKIEEIEKEKQVPKQLKINYLCEIIQKFEKVLCQSKPAQPNSQTTIPIVPSIKIQKQSLESEKYDVTIKEPRTSLDQKFTKTNIFKERIADIVSIIDPKTKWVIQNEETKSPQVPDISSNDNLRQYMLSRLGIDRQRRQEGNDQIHMGRIFSALEEYQQPLKEPKKDEKVEIKEPEKIEQKVQEKGEQVEEVKPDIMIEQKNEDQEISPQEIPAQIEQPRIEQEPIQIEQKDEPEKAIVENNQPQMQQQMVPEIQNQMEPMMEEQPTRHRQILSMLGLEQSFLRNCGIDEDLFDSLPQDMQIEQLNMLINTNRANSNANNNNNNGSNGENQGEGPQIIDPIAQLQNQNAAFIASLDPQLRAQTLMEATPEFLLTLPPEMRAQAENHRQRFIGRIIEEEELEEEEAFQRQKDPKAIKYPNMEKECFKDIQPKTAREMARNILFRFPKFNLEGFKILIENKKTQKTATNTVIAFARNISNLTLTDFTYNEQSGEWNGSENIPTGASRKSFMEFMLNIFYYSISKRIFKDDDFLIGKNTYETYCEQTIPVNQELWANQQGYYPLYELIELSLDNKNLNLIVELMKKVKELPLVLKKKIVRGMKEDRFPEEFYKNLEGLSGDQEMKTLFLEEFPETSPPKFETLSKVLQYEFSRIPYLKKLHSDALASYKENPTPQMSEFLSEIYRAYSISDIKELQEILIQHKNSHFQIIKYLYSKGRVLDKEPIGLILQLPHLLDFETKRFIFQHNPKLNRNRSRLMIEVNRRNLFMESYNQIMSHTARQLQHRVKVQFLDEPAEDAGGVKKEWFLEVSRQIFNREYALFQPSESGNTYQPNPKSYVNPEHLNYFKFIGRFVAKALQQGMLIDAFFTRSFYKMILGQNLQLKDLEEQDFNFYSSMLWLKDNKVEGDEYTFSYIYDYFGKMVTKELVAGGQKIPVTQENKQEFIEKYSLSIMKESVNSQVDKFLEGFYEILPKEYISFFEASQLQLLMSGMPSIDLRDLKENTQYMGYQPTDPQIVWYWEILEEYSSQQLAHLIQFITGTSKIPLQGFSQLQGMNGIQKISIHKDCHINQLPRSHTCFNQLDLPAYENKEIMREKMRVAITWGSSGFGFM